MCSNGAGPMIGGIDHFEMVRLYTTSFAPFVIMRMPTAEPSIPAPMIRTFIGVKTAPSCMLVRWIDSNLLHIDIYITARADALNIRMLVAFSLMAPNPSTYNAITLV